MGRDEESFDSPAGQVELSTEDPGFDLVVAAGLAGRPLSVAVVSRFLEVDERQALSIAEGLVERGLLEERKSGFGPCVRPVVGAARAGYVARRLASALIDSGAPSSAIGPMLLLAADPGAAFPHLARAAAEAEERKSGGEAFDLAQTALGAAVDAGLRGGEEKGRLHLICARYLRSAGRSAEAADHLDRAVGLLTGAQRIDALGFAAAVADDRQHPQEAETILALASLEAAAQGELGKLGSLASFRARALHRVGFPGEADRMTETASVLLARHASPMQRFYAAQNRAWIRFDRGEAAAAQMDFARLRDEAEQLEGIASVADKEAWLARAHFPAGRPDEALTAVARARDLATEAGVEAPLFLADLALADGCLAYGRPEEALAAADRALDRVERQLPAWRNVAEAERARALLALQRFDEAATSIGSALDATPDGANGWRWRTRCRALQLEIEAAAGRGWAAGEAEDLADHMLQSGLLGWAAELLCVIAERSKSKDAAREGLALALRIGNPMLAARAASIGKLWTEPVAAGAIRGIRNVAGHISPEWEDEWASLGHVGEALDAPEPRDDEGRQEEAAVLDEAMRRAGLAGVDVVLSPAQRRNRGLVRRRRAVRPLRWAAAAAAVVVIAGGTAMGVAMMQPEPVPGTVRVEVPVTATTQPVVLSLEETVVTFPADVQRISGTADHRGGPARTGLVAGMGPLEVNGHYWSESVVGLVQAPPVAYGTNLLVGTTDGVFYALDQTTGRSHWTMDNLGRISAAPALASISAAEGGEVALVLIASEDGSLRARDAVFDIANLEWSTRLGSSILASPAVFEDLAVAATADGFVYGVSLGDGATRWVYPDGEEGIGQVSVGVTVADGIAYVATERQEVHLLDAADGRSICVATANAPIVDNPIVTDGAMYVRTLASLHVFPAGSCSGSVPDRFPFPGYLMDTPTELAPAVSGDILYVPDGLFLEARDLPTNEFIWESPFRARGAISTPPVVDANGLLYVGDREGYVYAVDAEDGSLVWEFDTGTWVRAAPVIVDGVAFLVSGDGEVYAVGP